MPKITNKEIEKLIKKTTPNNCAWIRAMALIDLHAEFIDKDDIKNLKSKIKRNIYRRSKWVK